MKEPETGNETWTFACGEGSERDLDNRGHDPIRNRSVAAQLVHRHVSAYVHESLAPNALHADTDKPHPHASLYNQRQPKQKNHCQTQGASTPVTFSILRAGIKRTSH